MPNKRGSEKFKANKKAKKKRCRDKIRAWIVAYKIARPCVCGEDHPDALDFHHRVPSDKKLSMGHTQGLTLSAVMREAEKCVVLCANCHRKGHAGSPRPEHAEFFFQPSISDETENILVLDYC